MRHLRLFYPLFLASFGAFCAQAAAQDITTGLIGNWNLVETSGSTAFDSSSSSNNGTYVGGVSLANSTPVTNVGAVAETLNGSTGYVRINNESAYDLTGPMSVSLWIKVNSFDAKEQTIISKGDSAWRIERRNNNNYLRFVLQGPGQVQGNINVNDGQWHHVVGVYTGSQMQLYVDNVLDQQNNRNGAIATNNYQVNIGNNAEASGREFDGSIYGVRVYNRALTPADVATLYNPPLLVAHWKLNETSGTTAADSSGFNHTGTVTGTASWATGVLNNGFQFNGATKIQATGLLGTPRDVTLAAWAKLTTADSGGSDVVSLGDHVAIRLDESGVTKAFFYNGSGYTSVNLSQNFAGGGWHHFAATFDDTANSFKLYVDGVQAASLSTTESISYSGLGSNTIIGRQGNNGTANDFTGTIDDVRVYNYALTALEVAELYGFVGYWKLDQTFGTTATDSTIFARNGTVYGGANWSTRCTGVGDFDFNGTSNYISIPDASNLQPTSALTIAGWIQGNSWGSGSNVNIVLRKGEDNPNNYQLAVADGRLALFLDDSDTGGIRGNTVLTPGEWYHVAATWDGNTANIYLNGQLDATPTTRTGTIGTDTRPVYIGGRAGTDQFDGPMYDVRLYNRALAQAEIGALSGLGGYWKLDETSGMTAADSSGNGLNGTIVGSPAWATGYIDGAVDLNGSTKVEISSIFGSPRNVTFTAWANLDNRDGSGSEVVSIGDYFALRLDSTTTSSYAFFYNGSSWTALSFNQSFQGNGWHFFAVVFNDDSDTFTIYVDGVQVATMNTSQSIVWTGLGTTTALGRHGNGQTAFDFDGRIDDVHIYTRALCPEEIQQLYGDDGFEGVRIIQWQEVQ